MLNGKATIVVLTVSEYFWETKSLGKVKFELDQSNYATKAYFTDAAGIDTSYFDRKG